MNHTEELLLQIEEAAARIPSLIEPDGDVGIALSSLDEETYAIREAVRTLRARLRSPCTACGDATRPGQTLPVRVSVDCATSTYTGIGERLRFCQDCIDTMGRDADVSALALRGVAQWVLDLLPRPEVSGPQQKSA